MNPLKYAKELKQRKNAAMEFSQQASKKNMKKEELLEHCRILGIRVRSYSDFFKYSPHLISPRLLSHLYRLFFSYLLTFQTCIIEHRYSGGTLCGCGRSVCCSRRATWALRNFKIWGKRYRKNVSEVPNEWWPIARVVLVGVQQLSSLDRQFHIIRHERVQNNYEYAGITGW